MVVRLSPAALAEADAEAARAGVTRFVVLLSRWAASLAEVTGRTDFAVGVPVSRRDSPGLERAVGCHIGMLCLRMRGPALDDGPDAVADTGRIVARAMAAQDVSFTDVLGLVDPPRTGRPPLYQTLFALQDNPAPLLDLGGTRTRFLRGPYLDLPLELHAELWPEEDHGLRLEISYRPEAVPADTARALAEHFAARAHLTAPGVTP
ncbi:hypothetical protein CRI70_31630 [Streptomyces sp. Ru87]|nr:hypothetical protein CRI70_31630 [Streptomyces sp. Ru87]